MVVELIKLNEHFDDFGVCVRYGFEQGDYLTESSVNEELVLSLS
jgi:hypothetical protein